MAALLTARLTLGVARGWRLARRATSIQAGWTAGQDVRVSLDVALPFTVARTILLPAEFFDWDATRRHAVLAHEASHAARGDFYLLLLAALYRCLFWFNPTAWWLSARLADLAEATSDAAALETLEDRTRYAEILIDLAGKGRKLPFGVAMARRSTVRRRIERILTESTIPVRPTLRKLTLVAAGMIPMGLVAAGATSVPYDSEAHVRQRMTEQARPRTEISLDPAALSKFAGYYATAGTSEFPLKVTLDGGHLLAGPIGGPGMEIFPESDHAFFAKIAPAQQDFRTDASGHAIAVILHQNGYDLTAERLDDAAGRALEAALAARIAGGRPQPGGEEALRSHIRQIQGGILDDRTVSFGLAHGLRAMVPLVQAQILPLGAIRKVQFKQVDTAGRDVYLVFFERGAQEWHLRLAHDGRIESLSFLTVSQ